MGTPKGRSFLTKYLGPGFVTGAADDDPSGIATYTQAGAQFGTGLLWTVFLTLPFMVAIQMVSGRIGRVTGKGIAANLRDHMPMGWLAVLICSLVVANTINIAADIAAMGEALQLVAGGGEHFHALIFGLLTVLLQVFVPYRKLVNVLKWLALALFGYMAALFTLEVKWLEVLRDLAFPRLQWRSDYWMMIVALLGTTISPYLFFWQASQEVEEMRLRGSHRSTDFQVKRDLHRVQIDTWLGMTFSSVIAFCVMVVGSVGLHATGAHHVVTATQAAEALRPLAGDRAFWLFAAGIIATGLLAVPVLASSAAYAVAEALGWEGGLDHDWRQAKQFYGIITVATLAGTGLDFTPLDPMKALYWSAVVNGVVTVPIMIAMMLLAMRTDVMGKFTAGLMTRYFGWAGTGLMSLSVLMMCWDLFP